MAGRLALLRSHGGTLVTLTTETLPEFQRALADAGVDGWLLYDFRGLNPIAGGLMRLDGMTTRRVRGIRRQETRMIMSWAPPMTSRAGSGV